MNNNIYFLGIILQMAERNMQQTINDFLKFGNTILKTEHFHRSKKSIDVFDKEITKTIVSDAFVYSKNKETDQKYFIGHEYDNKIRPLFLEVS